MSNLSATLRELGIEKPGVEEYLDLTKFVDKKIEVRVGNKQKQGRTYNTVESIKGL
jgi:ASC-1-like (ASCH) protein